MSTVPLELPSRVELVEVGPRDGLQNERVRLSTERKVALIHHLVDAGFRHVEIGSFVHPKWIPQMADTGDVLRRVERKEGVCYWALVPNMRGLENALEAGATHIAVFVSSSETHNKRNINRTIDESLQAISEVVETRLGRRRGEPRICVHRVRLPVRRGRRLRAGHGHHTASAGLRNRRGQPRRHDRHGHPRCR